MTIFNTTNYQIGYEFFWDDAYLAILSVKDNNGTEIDIDYPTHNTIQHIMNHHLEIGNNHMDKEHTAKLEEAIEWFKYQKES